MRNKYIGLFLFFLAYASLALGQSISFSNNPKHLQLYPRSLTTNTATVKHKGAVNTAGYTSIKIVLLQNGLAVDSVSQALIYVAGNASFDLNNTIVAARNLYTFKCVLTSAAGAQVLVAQADSVVCGDVFLIQGQFVSRNVVL